MAPPGVFGELLPGSLAWSCFGADWAFLMALLVGASVWPRLSEREDPGKSLVVWWLVGTSTIGPLVLALSALGKMTPGWLVSTCAVVTIVTGVLVGRRVVGCAWLAARGLASEAREGGAATRIGMAALALVLGLAMFLAFIPTTHYDDLVYHLGLPRQALITGAWPVLPYFHHSLMPAGWEAAQALPLALGGGSGPQLMNAGVLMLLAAATLRLARRGASGWAPWTATALVLSFPVFIGLGSLAGNDLIVALGLVVALETLLAMDDGAGRGRTQFDPYSLRASRAAWRRRRNPRACSARPCCASWLSRGRRAACDRACSGPSPSACSRWPLHRRGSCARRC